MPDRTVPALVLALGLLAQGALSTTWIVDPAGGGHFGDLPAAIAAARSGDLPLLRAGTFHTAPIDKALSIHGGYGGGVSTIEGQSVVRGIGPGRFVHQRVVADRQQPGGGVDRP